MKTRVVCVLAILSIVVLFFCIGEKNSVVLLENIDLSKINISSKRNHSTTFSIGPRGDVFFAKQDGTVWNYTYGDGYACFSSSGQEQISAQPIHAFDISPVRMSIQEHGGVLIDDQGSLWGWGAFSKEVGSFDWIMDNVADVQLSFDEALILCEDSTLWAWLRHGTAPVLLAENIHACGYSTYPLALKHNGELVMLELILNHNATAIDRIREKTIMEDVFTIDGGFIYEIDGTLYTLTENCVPIKRFIGAVQAVTCGEGIAILDANGNIWLQKGMDKPQYITTNVERLITHDEILYINLDRELCLFRDGEVYVLDTNVLEATAGYMPNDRTHSILYSKGDNNLWRIGRVDDKDFVNPELITDQLFMLF